MLTSYVIKKIKLKQQLNITTHLLEWPKSRALKIPNANKAIEQQKLVNCWK